MHLGQYWCHSFGLTVKGLGQATVVETLGFSVCRRGLSCINARLDMIFLKGLKARGAEFVFEHGIGGIGAPEQPRDLMLAHEVFGDCFGYVLGLGGFSMGILPSIESFAEGPSEVVVIIWVLCITMIHSKGLKLTSH